jgi:hypothetical protein
MHLRDDNGQHIPHYFHGITAIHFIFCSQVIKPSNQVTMKPTMRILRHLLFTAAVVVAALCTQAVAQSDELTLTSTHQRKLY